MEVSKLRGEYVAPALARARPSPSSARRGWTASGVALGDIRPSAVQQWVADLSRGDADHKPLGASMVQRTHQVFSAILADAVKDRMIVSNPAGGVKLPRKVRKRPVFLTHDQVAELAGAGGEYAALILVLAYTGLRWGEATGLRVRDLDMLRKRASVSENAVQVGSRIHVGTTKGHKQRSVPLPAFLLPRLARRCEGKGRDDLLFLGDDGEYMERPHTGSGWFDKACVTAKVPRVTPHDLRHTAASLAVSAGANVKAVQRMLGHASAAMTLDVYADLFDDDLEAVATAMDSARARASVGKMWADAPSGGAEQSR